MTKHIQEPVMDPYNFIDDYGYSRLDHMDGLGMQPGMIRGPLTGLPIPAPEPVLSWDDMSWRERIDSIKPGLAVTAGLVLFIVVVGLIGIGLASLGVRA